MSKVKLPTKAEEKKIKAGIKADPDTYEPTDKELAELKPASEVLPKLVEEYKRTRGKQKTSTKVPVSLRLDEDVVEYFRAQGKGWQGTVNQILKAKMSSSGLKAKKVSRASVKKPAQKSVQSKTRKVRKNS